MNAENMASQFDSTTGLIENRFTYFGGEKNWPINQTTGYPGDGSAVIGKKYDSGKPQYGLIPPNALKQVAEVLTFGATKYGPDNWRHVENAKERYFDALQRHVWEWKMGQQTDPETAKHHMTHAICCALFIAELEITKD